GEEGFGSLAVDDAYNGGPSIHVKGDARAPKVPATVVFRVCDYYAWGVSRTRGAPRCELYWPEADRDKAVAACAEFLQRFGERLRYSPIPAAPEESDTKRARLTFPLLNRPATTDEERRGRAIFALVGTPTVRTVK